METIQSLPLDLVRALPKLLLELMKRGSSQSLERLQLLSLSIEPKPFDKDALLVKPQATKTVSGISLKGDLVILKNTFGVTIDYFLRGERKFLKVESEYPKGTTGYDLKPVSLASIENFFKVLGQSNSFFFNQDLAELNGRRAIQIPSQMLIYLILTESLKASPFRWQNLMIKFYQTAFADENLAFSYGEDHGRNYSVITCDDKLILSLERARN